VSVIDKVRSFAEARCDDNEIVRGGFTYGDMRQLLKLYVPSARAEPIIQGWSVDWGSNYISLEKNGWGIHMSRYGGRATLYGPDNAFVAEAKVPVGPDEEMIQAAIEALNHHACDGSINTVEEKGLEE